MQLGRRLGPECQGRAREHAIRDGEGWRRQWSIAGSNPVKHGLVSGVRDWTHSSFYRDVRRGNEPADWAGEAAEGEFGE